MATIKGGCRQETVFDTVEWYLNQGLTVNEAIIEIENILRCKLPETILNIIKQKWG